MLKWLTLTLVAAKRENNRRAQKDPSAKAVPQKRCGKT